MLSFREYIAEALVSQKKLSGAMEASGYKATSFPRYNPLTPGFSEHHGWLDHKGSFYPVQNHAVSSEKLCNHLHGNSMGSVNDIPKLVKGGAVRVSIFDSHVAFNSHKGLNAHQYRTLKDAIHTKGYESIGHEKDGKYMSAQKSAPGNWASKVEKTLTHTGS